MAKIVNTVTVQTAQGKQVVTKTSTHRTYVQASAVRFEDGTQAVLSWHLTNESAHRYLKSAEAQRMAQYAGRKASMAACVVLLPVTVQEPAKKAPKAESALYAPATIDEAPAAAPVAETGTTGNTCRCGCGEAIGTRSQYRPGHDARHAGIVARDIASSASQYFERVTADSDLGSEALVRKAHAMADRLIAKQAKKASK